MSAVTWTVIDLGTVSIDPAGRVTGRRSSPPPRDNPIAVPLAVHVEVDGRCVPAWLEVRA